MPYELALPALGRPPLAAAGARLRQRHGAAVADAVRIPVRLRGREAVNHPPSSSPPTTRPSASRPACAGRPSGSASRPGGQDWEAILVDDGSTDDTVARARRVAGEEALDLKVMTLRREPGQGRGDPHGRARLLGRPGPGLRHGPLDAALRVGQARRAAADASRGHRLARPEGRPRAQAPALPPRAPRPHGQHARPAPRRARDPRHPVRLQALPRRRRAGALRAARIDRFA